MRLRSLSSLILLCWWHAIDGFVLHPRTGLVRERLCLGMTTEGVRQRAKGTTKRDFMLEQMLESVDYTRSKNPPQIPLLQDPLLPMVNAIVVAADKRKAGAISAFRVSHMTEITTFMIVVEGNSRPQNQAIALAVEVSERR